MDAFEESMEAWARMSKADQKKVEKQDRERCKCPGCPTYADCAKKAKELLFCLSGKSSCIKTSNGCHCPGCMVRTDYGMTNIYFCLNGTEAEIRKGA
jgi:hypothetical protein